MHLFRLLYNLVKKDHKWNWIKRQKKAFRELKKRFMKELVLVVPDLNKKIRIEVDILNYAIGEVLLIETSCIIVKISQ